MIQAAAPVARLDEFESDSFHHEGRTLALHRRGTGPAVIVLTEMPGISPQVLGFATTVASAGFSVVLPDLFGDAGRDPFAPSVAANLPYAVRSVVSTCVSREFTVFATGRSSPIVDVLRALAAAEHSRAGGPGVGVVGMCFTGGFALAMATTTHVLAPVLSQPSLPLGPTRAHRESIDCSAAELAAVKRRCEREGLTVLGLRFHGDPLVPAGRFRFLREELGEAFVGVELDQSTGHPANPLLRHHSVLTASLVNAPGEPTRMALDQVLELFRRRLLPT